MTPNTQKIELSCPSWMESAIDWNREYRTDEDKMDLVIGLSRENVSRNSGGPFGAAVFEGQSGRLVSAGVNSVVRLNNSVLHAEMLAIMLAEDRLQRYSLRGPDVPSHEIFSSCAPCAMCLAGLLWSGVERIVSSALREDAMALGFEEGPEFPASHQYLQDRGIKWLEGFLRDQAVSVLTMYRDRGGTIYNGASAAT